MMASTIFLFAAWLISVALFSIVKIGFGIDLPETVLFITPTLFLFIATLVWEERGHCACPVCNPLAYATFMSIVPPIVAGIIFLVMRFLGWW